MKKFSSQGFTVLELIIVIGIMCILISLILIGLGAARAHSHDENKISTIQTIVVGLGQYHDICNAYPAALDPVAATASDPCLGGKAFTSLVPDIANYNFNQTGSDYEYVPLASANQTSLCTAFHIGVKMETTDAQIGSKSGFFVANQQGLNQLSVCGGTGSDFDGTAQLVFDIKK